MTEEQSIGRGEILALTTEIVSAHLANNATGQSDVPDLIQSVFSKLSELAERGGRRVGGTDAGGSDQEVGDRRPYRMSGRRQETEDGSSGI